jgi:hypothetical protein
VVRPLRSPDPISRSASSPAPETVDSRPRSTLPIGLHAAAVAYVQTYQYGKSLERFASTHRQTLEPWLSALTPVLAALEEIIASATRDHVMWPWISGRVAANPVVVGRLLARLKPDRAPTPSAFWRFCGLATVPGVELKCDRCGRVVHLPRARPTSCTREIKPGRRCGGACLPVGGRFPTRIAQRWITSPHAARSAYDPEARTAAYLLSHDLVGRSPHYATLNRKEQERLLSARLQWSFQHRLRAARRRTTKTFLADLWLEWRAIDQPVLRAAGNAD